MLITVCTSVEERNAKHGSDKKAPYCGNTVMLQMIQSCGFAFSGGWGRDTEGCDCVWEWKLSLLKCSETHWIPEFQMQCNHSR